MHAHGGRVAGMRQWAHERPAWKGRRLGASTRPARARERPVRGGWGHPRGTRFRRYARSRSPFASQGAVTVEGSEGSRKETSVMSAPAASTANIVRVFTQEELEARKAAVVEELERRFGSLDRALEREEDWDYDDDEARLFSEYHAINFLLSD